MHDLKQFINLHSHKNSSAALILSIMSWHLWFSIWHQFVTIFLSFIPIIKKKKHVKPSETLHPSAETTVSPCLFFLLDAASSFISFLFSLSFCSFFFSFVSFFKVFLVVLQEEVALEEKQLKTDKQTEPVLYTSVCYSAKSHLTP